jgi:hypothetical protein
MRHFTPAGAGVCVVTVARSEMRDSMTVEATKNDGFH